MLIRQKFPKKRLTKGGGFVNIVERSLEGAQKNAEKGAGGDKGNPATDSKAGVDKHDECLLIYKFRRRIEQ